MENIQLPYSSDELKSASFQRNHQFLLDLEKRVENHPVFDHPFLVKFANSEYSEEGVLFVLKQFGKIVMPFTAAICKLMGSAPDIKSRFMLMDNLYEEMGHNSLNNCHPVLYLKMLDSIGISQRGLEKTEAISSIRLLNNTIFDAVSNKSFAIGCSWLGFGGELTIPNNFPYLIQGIKNCFGSDIDMGFWNRHGARDQDHSDDATTVLCMNTNESEYKALENAVMDSLNLRSMIWSELEKICDEKYQAVFFNVTDKIADKIPA